MFVVCRNHVEQAIDEFIDMHETPPDVYRLDSVSFTDWTVPKQCDRCGEAPEFLVV